MASNIAPSVQPALRQGPASGSPHTPNRLISSTVSSPPTKFRLEEDAIIIELGSRFLRAGFEGEPCPQCAVTFGPEASRRVGDYRTWAPGGRRKYFDIDEWGRQHELWRMDLTDVDLGLVGDKIERAVREVYANQLLINVGTARLVLVIPSLLPHPLLSAVITTLFSRWSYPSITLLPSPTMAAVGAGLRSAMVIDLGWSETTATAVYEYREVTAKRSTRSMQSLLKELGRELNKHRKGKTEEPPRIDFDLAEDLMTRMVWCQLNTAKATEGDDPVGKIARRSDLGDTRDKEVEIDWPTESSSELVRLPFKLFSQPVDEVFFPTEIPSQLLDDHELSLPMLVYESLQALPPDVRAVCMSRIVFVGGGADVPGLTLRVLSELRTLVDRHGWSRVRGDMVERRAKLRDLGQGRAENAAARNIEPLSPGRDYVEERVQKQRAREPIASVQGAFRVVGSLGAWAGASLMAKMKIKGFVEIEREKFLQHGLAGAHRDVEVSVVPQRTNHGGPLSRTGGDRRSWTLAGWG